MTPTTNTTAAPWEDDTPPAPVSEHLEAIAGIPQNFPDHIDQGSQAKGMAGLTKGILWKVPRDRLTVMPGLNVRANTADYRAHISRIARSMFAEGWMPDKPVAVFVDKDQNIVVKDGHSRLMAFDEALALGAQIDHIPCVYTPDQSIVDITVGLVKSNEGRPLLPIEKAIVCQRLARWGWDHAKIAERLDFSPIRVKELLALLGAPAALVDLVKSGDVALDTALIAIRAEGAAEATKTIVEAVKAAKVAGKKASPKAIEKARTDKKVAAKVQKVKAIKAAAPESKAVDVSQALEALRAVFDDPAFARLDDKVQCIVIDLVGT